MLVTLGSDIKRKSVEKVNPTLPKVNINRQKSTQGRTKHQQYKPPSEQLKQFRKKQLITLSTQKSLTNLASDQEIIMKHSRFDDDHHNTQSIAQLLNSKMVSHPNTFRTQFSKYGATDLTTEQDKIKQKKESLQSQSIPLRQSQHSNKDKQNQSEGQQKQGQNYDDYVLGQKVDEQDDSNQSKHVHKKYVKDDLPPSLQGYIPRTQSQRRLEQQYWNKQFKKYRQAKQDKQILGLLQEYQLSKQKVMNQSKRKHQTQRVLASIHHQQQENKKQIQKSCSLPLLKPKVQVIIPQYPQELSQIQKASKNMLTKTLQQKRQINNDTRLKKSLSFGKLGFGKKRVRTICEQDVYQDELNSVQTIKTKLRSKGIVVDTKKLTQGLINQKNYPVSAQVDSYPSASLPSNFLLKKFPL